MLLCWEVMYRLRTLMGLKKILAFLQTWQHIPFWNVYFTYMCYIHDYCSWDTETNVSSEAAFFHIFFLFVNNKNELFFYIYKTYTSFEPHLLYKQEMLQWMLHFFLILFSFQWNTEVVNNQHFFPVNTDKEKGKKEKTASSDNEKKKSTLLELGLNMATVQTLGLRHKEVFRRQLLEQWDDCSQIGTRVRRLVWSHCL